MRKLIFPVLMMCALSLTAQYNNSWIDYNKTYYKFKVSKNGLHRISQPVLSGLGLGAAPAQDFQLWRNGAEVRLYTSISSGPLGANDYIEFIGKMNDGLPDKPLYRAADNQLSDSFSVHTDTATYYLTLNAATPNLRYSNAVNNVSGNTLPPDPYFMRRVEQPYKQVYNAGLANVVGEYVYSSSYDAGEGWTTADIYPCCPLSQVFNGLNVYTAGPANSVSFYIAAFGNAPFSRNLQVKLNNTLIIDTAMNNFSLSRKQLDNLPLTYLQNPDNLSVTVSGNSTNTNDRIVVGTMAVTYPAKFNFNNQKNFYFDLGPSTAGNFLEIDNFNTSGVAPVLYSINDGRRYAGDITIAGKVRFALPSSSDHPVRKFMLANEEQGNINIVTTLTSRTFINYAVAANQGDYLVITNPVLFNDGSGNNYVDQYRAYRASSIGGGFNVKVILIDELTDQFAFGIKKHPAAIRDFIRFANQAFTVKPKYIFLVGRGMASRDFKNNENSPDAEKLDLVTTFGWPASDILLAAEPAQLIPLIPIGRLSVINGKEIKYYLDKVKQYEAAQVSASQTVADKAWMKNFIHAAGGATADENRDFTYYLNSYAGIAKDTSMGAKVEIFQKESSSAVVQADGERIEQLINEGTAFIQYFGHSSANILAFNLNNPENYTNPGKYPFFNVSGCSAGNNYIYDPTRLNGMASISEKWVISDQRGSIGFLASTHFGIPPFLTAYNTRLYQAFSRTMYGNTIGNQMKYVIQDMGANPQVDFYTRMHLEQLNLNGDPAIKINNFSKPDYAIEDQLVKLSPSIISVADNNFNVKIKFVNLGKALGDTIRITVKRLLPNDTLQVIYDKLVPGLYYADSLDFNLRINGATDKGLNKLICTIDADNKVAELSEINNTFTREFTIFEDEIRPVYPYNFSIINQPDTRFIASTANPLIGTRQYLMELDTTELFNSPFKKQYTTSGAGGAIEFSPGNIGFKDSTVYYWRTSMEPLNNALQVWNSSSFVYLPNGSTGFNQSHYFQHRKSTYSSTIAIEPDRLFHFAKVSRTLVINTGLYPFFAADKINVNLDFEQLDYYGCRYNSLQFMVFDTTTLTPWKNYKISGTTGRFGSNYLCPEPTRNFFEFSYQDPVSRKHAMDFLDSIPNGMYVSVTNLGATTNTAGIPANTSFIEEWKADQSTLGAGNSLYHKLKSIGFNTIDSFYHNLPFSFFYRKNVPSYTASQIMGIAANAYVVNIIPLTSSYDSGTIESPVFGPAKKWNSLQWRGRKLEAAPGDTVHIQVYGVKADGSQSLLATVFPATDTTLGFIDAAVYPYVKLKMLNKDERFATPNQLNYWRINADYVPEGAVAPNILFTMQDSVEQGAKINFSLAFKNISPVAFDSLTTRFVITDRTNTPHVIAIPKKKALVAGDTLVVSYSIDTKDYPGNNTLYVMVNPDYNQPEQYSFNNLLYKDFFVKEDKVNPVLDVTFDGVHILNKDIVASRPHILIKLQDESQFLLLSDTASLKVQVHYPGDASDVYRNFYFGDNMRFIPATTGADNTASIEFSPFFAEDGEYELKISGKDIMGNKAGNIEYKVTFSVINTPMISNMLNYPNPFTTSTAFVFTLTGSEVPQNIRIQILTITGKIVREITKAELGDIHIGRNITSFKWDGTDMYGQKLGNGVYLYRVLTNLNGKSLDKYKSENDQTDKFFNKGYGKMYLMR